MTRVRQRKSDECDSATSYFSRMQNGAHALNDINVVKGISSGIINLRGLSRRFITTIERSTRGHHYDSYGFKQFINYEVLHVWNKTNIGAKHKNGNVKNLKM